MDQLVSSQGVPSQDHVHPQRVRHQCCSLGSIGVVAVHRVQLAGLAGVGHSPKNTFHMVYTVVSELLNVRPQGLLPAPGAGMH